LGGANPDLVHIVGRLIADGTRDRSDRRPPLIAVVGAQGSGKTTLARAAAARFGAVQISLDDVYLTRRERAALAARIHPLFATRGPPGTHDLGRLETVIDALSTAGPADGTPIPRFDKRADDRAGVEAWPVFQGRPSAVLIDGWCLGALPEAAATLAVPVNALEAGQDPDGVWRRAVNTFVGGSYAAFRDRFDAVLFLRATGFDRVLDWRCEQEADLLGVAPADLPAADRARLARFIQHFERLTRRMLDGAVSADVTVQLDRNRCPGSMAG
jgi:D-glycerate 3-kinase